jgi:cephalosporin-C deacetylase-like acetyl esterase
MKRFLFPLLVMLAVWLTTEPVSAQPARELVQVVISPDQPDWLYKTGDRPEFSVSVRKNQVAMTGIQVNYEYGPEMMDPEKTGSEILKKTSFEVKLPSVKTPGFYRFTAWVTIDGKRYSSFTTVGFSPERIEPTVSLPADFREFWNNAMESLKKVPVAPVLTLMPERSTDLVEVYHVKLDNLNGKVYGILCKPRKPGRYPAVLHVPGAGARPYEGDIANAARGIITFQIGIHGVPVNMPTAFYSELMAGPIRDYWTINMDDRDNYYYKRVYLGCVRAVDFLTSLGEFDGSNLAVHGGSQGGALAIVTASLDKRVKFLSAYYPALCDLTGYLNGRAGGWPHMFKNDFTRKPDKVAATAYYDVVNFARFVEVPGWYSWGYNDNVCPPTSMHAAYNVIKAPRELHIFQEAQHWTYPEQRELAWKWISEKLGR